MEIAIPIIKGFKSTNVNREFNKILSKSKEKGKQVIQDGLMMDLLLT